MVDSKSISIGVLSSLFGAIIGAIATITTAGFGYMNRDRELDIKMVEVGLSILKGEATENSRPARAFAITLLEKYSDVEIANRDDWIDSGDLPFEYEVYDPRLSLLTTSYNTCIERVDPRSSDQEFQQKAVRCEELLSEQ